ncbi:PREDICTED: LEAF RUST 10 DISEASE-RESISTANCE LOCUS RECEPTOR-LIKE PROTEIN KINASE-like 1.2 isoform X3 [Nicotiana attenuata]|uniref:LEAF RUST 10 DISEASE-RESISTANCE LOCUS RECEPTOR-LIKE PROTEIN KINASE-like 1.2 isoform X3 n=1 Tax=Nicotiana attenuata TaxID=49451 RepID=UPI000904F073|nr:PREDICTED: LEAF RUST 10 DISEASE-RESISTANCE LOCUS RECEPTOR-LIKE PROTEIN KINASE-like 1.2 isoform X3 [Nicotiana attenuata]
MCPSQLFSFFFVFLLLLLFINSSGANTNTSFAYCPSSICHGRNISYPFWSLDSFNSTSPQYCGYPGFGIQCSQIYPILNISNDSFFVKEIDYTTYSLTLVDIDALIDNRDCPRPHHNLTLGDLPLKYSKLDMNLTFYFNCIDLLSSGRSLDCLNSGGNKSYLYVEDNEPDDLNWSGICEKKVVAVVMDSGLTRESLGAATGEELTKGLVAAMDGGFVLDWRIATECGKCEASDGRCGYNNSTHESLCYCKDGTVTFDHCNGVGAAAITALMAGVIFFIYRCRQKKIYAGSSLFTTSILSYPSSIKDPEKATSLIGVHLFDYNELDEATNNFDSKKELGDGGYGTVYKGKLRDGRVVAVKRLYENNCKRVEQFMNEIDILTRLHHPNLVTLYGCTSRHSRELLLVYEYIPNGTVADHLHGVHSKPGSLSWNTRMKISLETASALAYLHASDVIHRDVKTNNILLDNNFCVKVADFGLSRLFPTDVTHVSTAPQGTPGYVDPEYHECYQLTDKSDVYSFGVVLIELISSLPAVDIFRHRHEINLSNMAINKIQGNALHELVDSNLGFDTDDKVRSMITTVAELAFQCLQSDRELRPSMQEVVEALMRIQRINKTTGKTDKECPDDDTGLLNSITLSVSPDSVTTKWSSSPTTPNAST